jgi:thiol-disulfide isomerase/thioredoxin
MSFGSGVLFVVRAVLALTFTISGIAKLADRSGTQRAVAGFGVPASLAAPLGIFLPTVELAVAAALIPTSTAWWGAVGALALLTLFVVGISVNLIRGRQPDCHCFGQLHSAPVGWKTLARNGALAAAAAFVVWQGQGGTRSNILAGIGAVAMGGQALLFVTLTLLGLLAVESWLLVNLMRRNGQLLLRIDALEGQTSVPAAGLPVDLPAPPFRLRDLHGESHGLNALCDADVPALLIFWNPNCGPCLSLLPEIARWQCDLSSVLNVVLISRGGVEENLTKTQAWGVAQVLLQKEHEVAQAYKVGATPAAVIVRPNGRIGSPLAVGTSAMRGLVARAADTPTLQTAPITANGSGAPVGDRSERRQKQ